MKTLIVFIHTTLMDTPGDYTEIVLAVPFWQAKYSKVFTSISDNYVPYTPVAFDVI